MARYSAEHLVENWVSFLLGGLQSPEDICREALERVLQSAERYMEHEAPEDPETAKQYQANLDELKKYVGNFKGARSMITKLNAKSYPELTKLLAETSPKPVKHIRHKGHDFTIYQKPGGFIGKDKYEYTLDGENFSNEDKGYKSLHDAMNAIKQYVQENKKAFQSTAAGQPPIFPWANLPYPEYVQDVANLLLCDQISMILEGGDLSDDGIDESTVEEWRKAAIRPGEDITKTIPEYFTQNDFGYHRFLPTQEAGHMIEQVDKTLRGKLTFEQIWEHDSNLAARFILQMLGHGVGPLDDEEDEAWLLAQGVTEEMIERLPHEEAMDAFDSAHDLLLSWFDFKSEPPPEEPAAPEEAEPENGPHEPPEEPETHDEDIQEEPAEEPPPEDENEEEPPA
jgi:hypothetical protein